MVTSIAVQPLITRDEGLSGKRCMNRAADRRARPPGEVLTTTFFLGGENMPVSRSVSRRRGELAAGRPDGADTPDTCGGHRERSARGRRCWQT